jgi:hypothetical protein
VNVREICGRRTLFPICKELVLIFIKCFFQQDGTQPHTASTGTDIVNTYFQDGTQPHTASTDTDIVNTYFQDGTQPHTASTDTDIVNTYFQDGATSKCSIPWSVLSRVVLTLIFVFVFFGVLLRDHVHRNRRQTIADLKNEILKFAGNTGTDIVRRTI